MSKRRQNENIRAASKRGKRLACLLIAAALAVVVLLNYPKWLPPPDVPEVSFESLDPAIATVIRNARSSVAQNPRSDQAWGELGQVYMVYEYEEKAIECFDQAGRLNPDEPRWPYFSGVLHFPEQTDVCLDKLERSVRLFRDGSFAPRLRLATIYADLGRFDEAGENYQYVLDRDPDNPFALFGKGRVANATGEFEASVVFLERSADSPYVAKDANTLLSAVYLRLGNEEASFLAGEKAASSPQNNTFPDPFVEEASRFKVGERAWTDHAQQLVRRNQIDQALPLVLQILQDYPKSGDAWQLLGKIRLAQGDYAGAEIALRNAVNLAPQSVEHHSQLGVSLLYQNNFEDAIDAFNTALQYEPGLAEAHYNLGLSYGSLENFDASIESFKNAFQYKPDFIEAYLGAASVYLKRDQIPDAKQALAQAGQINPEDPRLIQMLERIPRQDP